MSTETTTAESATLPTLGEFIAWLDKQPPGLLVPLDPNLYSDRGDYAQVAISPGETLAPTLVAYLRTKVGQTMNGYKGGEYEIREGCAVFVAGYGDMGPRLGILGDRVILVGDGVGRSMSTVEEQARAEAEKRWPVVSIHHIWDGNIPFSGSIFGGIARESFTNGYIAGHEAATRTREVTTVAELDVLPVGSVVRSLGGGAAWQKMPVNGFWVGVIGNLDPRGMDERGYLPARVLHTPEVTP